MDQSECALQGTAWGKTASKETLLQVADLLGKQFRHLAVQPASSGQSFVSKPKDGVPQRGILSVRGESVEDSVIVVQMELARTGKNGLVSPTALFDLLANIGSQCRLISPQDNQEPGQTSLSVEMRVQAIPMSLSRENALLAEIIKIDEMAGRLQAELPVKRSTEDLLKQYEKVADFLKPITPWMAPNSISDPPLQDWARETLDLLSGAVSVAVASPHSLVQEYALAALAGASSELGQSIGQVSVPMINGKALLELTQKAPGIIVVPASRLTLGSNPYEMGHEVQSVLVSLSALGKPAVFSGTYEQLQSVFHGGQGGVSDPLSPIVRHVPDVPVEMLARFAIRAAGDIHGGLPARMEEELSLAILNSVSGRGPAEQRRLLSILAHRTVHAWKTGTRVKMISTPSFAVKVGGFAETLAGLSASPRATRFLHVQESFTRNLTGGDLLDAFKKSLLAQDLALEQLADRLCMEALTRPLHQPLRYCAQGSPGTGKSESAILLARHLSIPYVNIDAASMPDYYTAAAQLLGSGRGVVGSFQSGRLEQAAKHHAGAVIEISDLDHAVPTVRCTLADLFLQILETGEAQSATGAMFSCANLIFAFTMNLPGGQDETVQKQIGFVSKVSRRDVRAKVAQALKRMLSGAFLSRVGTPILFDPLDESTMAEIAQRAVQMAIADSASRLGMRIGEVRVGRDVGKHVVSVLEVNIASFGARALLEKSRSLATRCILQLRRGGLHYEGKTLLVIPGPEGTLSLELGEEEEENGTGSVPC